MNFEILHTEVRPQKNGRRTFARCCHCGAERWMFMSNIRRQKSCGCLNNRAGRLGIPQPWAAGKITHGRSGSVEYGIWLNMIQRCTNPKTQNFKNYGGRGIKVCERWRSFENFYSDIGPRPKGLSLGRKNNNLGYEPANVVWVAPSEQKLNRRTTLRINGKPLIDLAAESGKLYSVIYREFRRESNLALNNLDRRKVTNTFPKTDKKYWLWRLERDHPVLFADVNAGCLTVNHAVIQAGMKNARR